MHTHIIKRSVQAIKHNTGDEVYDQFTNSVPCNSMTEGPILSAYELPCREHFRLLKYQYLGKHMIGPFFVAKMSYTQCITC